MSAIIDAVTALLLHEGELFLAHRHPGLQVFAGYQAFPGGKVDDEDAAGSDLAHPALRDHDPRLLRALARELREELDFDLLAAAEAGAVRRIVEFARAVSPPSQPRRFDTRFFTVELRERPRFTLHAPESIAGAWDTPARWLQRYESGEFIAAPPTVTCLRALAAGAVPAPIGTMTLTVPPGQLAAFEFVSGLLQIPVRSHTLPPAAHTNCFVFGDAPERRIAVDPSPADAEEFERLSATLVAAGVDTLLITHHHPDHHERADALARRHRWPVLMSPATGARLGAAFLRDLDVEWIADGDRLTRSGGVAVSALAVPGHDDGQIAPLRDDGAWCIVGDLIQGVGTVVISRPEGNMQAYFATLERVIALAPRSIFPSHGNGLGTTFRLEETLRHRRHREQAVLERYRAGQNIDDMLAAIYPGLDPRLLPLARRNIESHLEKLDAEGRLAEMPGLAG